jgi:transcriptional regulator GlxA family with amidase domain
MLRVLGHLHDPDLAQTVSRLLLYQQERQQWVPELVSQRWLGKTTDSPVYRAIGWLQAHVDEPYRLAPAEAAAVSERTLLRHFRQVTGQTPLDYLHRLRVERAHVARSHAARHAGHRRSVRLQRCAAFRRLFQRAMQMSMSEYRTRFALRTRRRYWRVEGQGATWRAAPQAKCPAMNRRNR